MFAVQLCPIYLLSGETVVLPQLSTPFDAGVSYMYLRIQGKSIVVPGTP